jgi:RhtB (resistance to homoserine/threonine) family protein
MSIDLIAIATILGIHFLAVASPGPDFLLVLKNSLAGSKKYGIMTSFGIAVGIIVHVVYCLLGIAIVISQSILLFNIIKILGGAYLIYLGIKCLKSKKTYTKSLISKEQFIPKTNLKEAFKEGFITNALNPKATIFFLSVFTMIITPETSMATKLIASAGMVINTFLWFGLVSLVFTQPKIQLWFAQWKHRIDQMFGVMLLALGLKVILSKS